MNQPFMSVKKNVVLTAILYTFLWGCAFPLVKICMDSFGISDGDNISKCLIAGIRFTLSGIITLIWCFSSDKKVSVTKPELKMAVVYGVLATSMQYAFTYIGLSMVDGSKGAVFDQLCVFMTVLASGLFFKDDKLNLRKVLGCVAGFLGVVAINTSSIGNFDFSFGGEGMMILAALCQTGAYFLAKKSAGFMTAKKLVGAGQFIGGIVLVVFSVLFGGKIGEVNSLSVVSVLALAVISSVAYVLSLMPLKYFPASEISSFNLLITVFGVLMSALLLKENVFRWNYLISGVLISAGIILVNSRRKNHVESF